MPGKSAYPTPADVDTFLTAAGVTSGVLDTTTAAYLGRLEVEYRCGRSFFAVSGTRYYSPPVGTGYLDLGADLSSLVSLEYQPEGSSAETWTEHTDFWLLPPNAGGVGGVGYWLGTFGDPTAGEPHTGVQFARRWRGPLPPGLHRAIRITGMWGYATVIPEDAWLAMVMAGALKLLPTYGLRISEGRHVHQEAGVIRTYGMDPLSGVRDAWAKFVSETVARYKRPGL